ncbi:enhancin-like peptidase M60 family [Chitinophaga dinghuensis]|uniref:Enhancin-like peptidase M60 family n=1 Tax=Chitinophaga dinghuensis TaxID=1539050 RepID=A0A327W182_9BACT|nr:M60 family metallopeptidase [Chitinophaga dinghuensis]RAJ82016.1 enhancin-like peptidase M60 family [Chitinophaga dinghuensis]
MKLAIIKPLTGILLLGTILAACTKKYSIEDGYDKPLRPDTTGVGLIDTNMNRIDSSGFPDARKFPGLVSVAEPRLMNASVTLDLNYKLVSPQLRIAAPPGNWFSTGFYAGPGELVKVEIPQGTEGMTVQIGAHTDNINGKMPQLRAGVIVTRQTVLPGTNYIRNIYGGPIYLIPTGPANKQVTVKFSNVCKSPDFILGQSTDAAWKEELKHSQVPVVELRGKRFIITMYRKVLLGLLDKFNAEAVMGKWDEVIEKDYNEWYGLSDNPADPIDQAPGTPHRFVLDVQISLGSGHSGYPCMAYLDWHSDFLDTAMINSGASWGPCHEIGHNHQMITTWSWSGADALTETSNNLFVFKIANRFGRKPPRIYDMDQNFVQPALDFAKKDTASGKSFSTVTDVFQRLIPFVQLYQRYGYDMMGYVCKEARHAERITYIDVVKKDFFYVSASKYAQVDLYPFFKFWGINVSPTARGTVLALGLPVLKEQLWLKDIR